MRALRLSLTLLPLLFGSACGPEGQTAIAIRIVSAAQDASSIRAFDDNNPPEWVRVEVVRHSQLTAEGSEHKPVVAVQPAWDELETDPVSGRKILLLNVPPNENDDDPYVLQVASIVTDPVGAPQVDECGAVGRIVAARGAKVRVTVATHPGLCQLMCVADSRCIGSRYCLSFECQDARACTADDQCPSGSRCDAGVCTAACGAGLPSCNDAYYCCGDICSASCAD